MPNLTTSKKPTHIAYVVRDGKADQSFWRAIGSAWVHKDAKGFDLLLDAVPTSGRVVLRVNEPKADVE